MGHGRIVEPASRPGDPDNGLRDDLVFAAGTMHLVSTNVDGTQATGTLTGSVDGTSLFTRQADHSCELSRPPVMERDDVAASGTLEF
jgi:hypothetical protein